MRSGFFFPNKLISVMLQALQDVIGVTGMHAVYTLSGQSHLVEQLPPEDMERQFDFADLSKIFETLEVMFGTRGAHSLVVRAGRVTFKDVFRVFGKVDAPGFAPGTGPLGPQGVFIRLNRLSNFLNAISDLQTAVLQAEAANTFTFGIRTCPACINRTSIAPVCSYFEGLLAEAASSFSGGLEYEVKETQCLASGAEACIFEIKLNPDQG